jgi:4-amino-4-deoxy-L-arabinose transferase-like glycosyltransferase
VLALILLLAAYLRFHAINFGFPDWFARPDEANVTTRVMRMLLAGSFSPEFFEYPAIWLYLLRGIFAAAFHLGMWSGRWSDLDGFMTAYVQDPSQWLLAARLLAATSGVLTVGAVAHLGRRLGTSGLIAALFLAVAPLHVRDSHFGVTDVPVTLFLVLVLIWASRLYVPRPRHRDLWLAGLWVGLAGGTKYNAALIGIAPAAALFLAAMDRPRALRQIGLVAAVATLVFFLSNPYVLLDHALFLEHFAFQARHMIEGHGLDLGLGWIYHATDSLPYGLTWPLFLLSLLGIPVALARPKTRYRFLPPLLFALLYYAAMGRSRTVFFRYVIPLLPVLVLTADCAICSLREWLARRWGQRHGRATATFALLLALLCALPAALASGRIDRILSATDTREEARTWLLEHVAPDEGVVLAGGAIYGEPRLPGLEWCQILELEREPSHCSAEAPFPTVRMVDPRGGLATIPRGFTWVLTHEHPLMRYSALHFKLRAALERGAEEVAVFTPLSEAAASRPGDPLAKAVFDPIDAFYAPIAHAAGIARPGPTIRVWRLRSAP